MNDKKIEHIVFEINDIIAKLGDIETNNQDNCFYLSNVLKKIKDTINDLEYFLGKTGKE